LVAVRYQQLSAEITELDRHLHRLAAAAAPGLLALKGVGTDIAAALLLASGDNPQRLRSGGKSTAPLPRRMTASFSSAAPDAPRPGDRR
jgi:transposase